MSTVAIDNVIYVPRSVVTRILADPKNHNPNVCMKLLYFGFEISIACDSSQGPGNLARTDIRIWRGTEEYTERILRALNVEEPFDSPSELHQILNWCATWALP